MMQSERAKQTPLSFIQNENSWRNSLQYNNPQGSNRRTATKGRNNNMAGQGRKVNPLTAAIKESSDARSTLKAMVASYCDTPTPKKAKVIAAQLEKVEQLQKTIREEKAASETSLFGSDGEDDSETEDETEEDGDTTDDTQPVEEEKEKPQIPRPVTAKNNKK